MTFVLFILTAFSAFFAGFVIGEGFGGRIKPKPNKTADRSFRQISNEYRDFLNYDGTKQ